MANEKQTSPKELFEQLAPEGGWPAGMFPSPVRDEFFDPYNDAQDRQDYYRLDGSRDYILQFATIKAMRRQQGEPASYPDHSDMIEEAMGMVERDRQRQRIRNHFKRNP